MKNWLYLLIVLPVTVAATENSDWTVEGLEKPAEIIVDRWGVPHIYAQTHYDTFFVQGFNAARDRLWQLDIWRRRGLGELAEVLGPEYVRQDRATRLFLYRGDMYREWLAYGSDAKQIAESFASGINAWIDLTANQPQLLAPEFSLLGYTPTHWNAQDIVRIRSHGLLRNVPMEVRRAQILCLKNLRVAGLWKLLEPQWTTTVPTGLDPCVIPADVLDVYNLAKAPVSFNAPEAHSVSQLTDDERGYGSNNWVVAPQRTASGTAILADDPHRGHAVPSLRYISHLVGPGLNVIGAGEPALPGISIGHNENIAFGLTIFPIDQEDLYVYEKKGSRYKYAQDWERFKTINETIAVKEQTAAQVELKFTRHGPVIHETSDHVFAIKAAWLEPGMAPYFGSIEYMRASNWREFSASLNRWGAPSENQVYADIEGNIGYKPAGLFPRRSNWDGLLPVPGTGKYEWDGFFDMDVLPVEYNPARGFTGTANSMNLPADYPIEKYPLGFEWNEGWRYQRLWQVLASQDQHQFEDSTALQRDFTSVLAKELVARIPENSKGNAAERLRSFDGQLLANSADAALYAIWYYRSLQPAIADLLLPEAPQLVSPVDSRTILQLMAEPSHAALIQNTLDRAWMTAISLLGPNPATWRWGDLHKIRFKHPLLALAKGKLAKQMIYPEYPMGGSANTTNNTGFYGSSWDVQGGASYRQVIDVGNWDNARMTNAPGQSGDPRSANYSNLLQGWAQGDDFPLLFSRDSIIKHKAFTIKLRPE